MIVVYTTSNCNRCKMLKCNLDKNNIEYTEKDLEDTDAMMELCMMNVSIFSAPILNIDGLIFKLEDSKI